MYARKEKKLIHYTCIHDWGLNSSILTAGRISRMSIMILLYGTRHISPVDSITLNLMYLLISLQSFKRYCFWSTYAKSFLETISIQNCARRPIFAHRVLTTVSATDVITYIGVPLAVLGVLPILYTFASALYTRLKLQRSLRKIGFEAQIRARLMTGVVEADLPFYHLEPLERDNTLYWDQKEPKSISNASWSTLNWFEHHSANVKVRLQRSDKLKLPQARISFRALFDFLRDRGASPHVLGFRTLRQRVQQTAVGTILMTGDTDHTKGNNSPVLAVAKSGEQYGLISVVLTWAHRNVGDMDLSLINGFFHNGRHSAGPLSEEDQSKNLLSKIKNFASRHNR